MSTEASEVGAEPSLASLMSAEPTETANAETEVAQAVPAETTAAAEPAKDEPARGPDGKFAAKPETTATTETPKPEKTETAPQSERPDWVPALIAERRRRQAAESRAAATPPQEQPKPEAKPDFFENPERAVDERVNQGNAELDGKFFRLSLKAAKAGRADYDEVASAFTEAAKRDPRLIDALRADEDPGELIYALGLQIRELSDVNGDIVRYREKVTAETRAQLVERDTQIKAKDAEIEGLKKQLQDLSTVGRSLNTATSSRTASEAETDAEDLASLARFGNQRR